MTEPLWRAKDVVAATGGQSNIDGDTPITSVSIDTRTLQTGALFIAIKGDRLNGHDYLSKAMEAGAAAAIVSEVEEDAPYKDKLILVDDTLEALNLLGTCARARSRAKIIAVTGSVGKTGTKEALRLTLSTLGPTHASQKSYNNHWGVPLSLALMPLDAKYGVFEVGMNHPGEITPLTKMIRPDIAIITTVEPVHIGHFSSVEAIAEAKAEIFQGLKPGGTAILNGDNAHFDLLKKRAIEKEARIIRFGVGKEADVSIVESELGTEKSTVRVRAKQSLDNQDAKGSDIEFSYEIGAPGLHHVSNSLAVVGTLSALGAEVASAMKAMADYEPPAGRGTRVTIHLPEGPVNVIDESYNANPASMRAALSSFAQTQRASFPRRIAVLGDMLELGDHAERLHAELAGPIEDAEVNLVFASGPHMASLMEALPEQKRAAYADQAEDIKQALLEEVRAGDVVMIKGSLGSRMSPLVEALCEKLTEQASKTLAKTDG